MAVPDQILTLARKMSSDPAIQRQIAESFFRLSTSNPALGRRLLDGDPQAVFEAFQTLVRNNGSVPMPSGPPLLGARPIGPGETVGGVTGPGVTVDPGTGLVPATPRGLPHDPSATRQLTTTGGDAPDALDSAAREITVIDAEPGTGLIPSDGGALVASGRRGPGVRVGGVGGPPTRYGARGVPAVVDAPPPRGGLPAWAGPAAAAAYGTAVGIGAYNSVNRDDPAADDLDAAATDLVPDADVAATPRPRTWRDMTAESMGTRSTVTVDGLTLPSVLGSDGQPLGDGQYYTEGSRRAAERARAAAITRAGGPRGVPGPRTNDGRMPTPAPEFTTPEEAEAYYTRPRDPQTGALLPSQADVAMEQRGLVPTFGEDGEAHYQMGYSHLRGAGQDVRRNLQQYTNHRVPGTNTPAWQMESKDGPTGTFAAMVPTDALRQYNATQAQRASLLRNAARGSARAMQDLKAMGDLTPAEEVRLNNMLAERERADRFATMARLAGGSQGLRGGAGGNIGMFQALAMLEGQDPQNMDARNRAIMYSLPGGREAAAVDAANNAQLRDLGLRVATGQGFGGLLNPQAQELAMAERDRALREQAYNFAVEERNKVHTFNEAPMTRDFALRLKRRVAARFGPRYADVVDGLPIEGDMAAAVPQPAPMDIPGGP